MAKWIARRTRNPGVRGFESGSGSGCLKHLKIKGTRNYYFKTIGYCFRTKDKSPLILQRLYATGRWPLAGFVLGFPNVKSSAMLVNRQLGASCQLRFLTL